MRTETKPGVYRFEGHSDGGTFVVDDAHLLFPDADLNGSGSAAKPKIPPPAPCVAITGVGSSVWIVGFFRAPGFTETSDDAPVVGDADDNTVAGDKAYTTVGGAKLLLKRGGATILAGGSYARISLNPINNQVYIRGNNLAVISDGYAAVRGRANPSGTAPATFHTEDFLDQVGPAATRIRLKHGSIGSGAGGASIVRELTVASITSANGATSGTIQSRERYQSDGSWIGEGSKYQWGGTGANEPHVLGNQLASVLSAIITALQGLTVGTAMGPSTPPLPTTQEALQQISDQLSSGKIFSDYLFLTKTPAVPGPTND